MPSRALSSANVPNDHGAWLLPGETVRKPYTFPAQGDPCPHCGARTGFVHTATFFRCPRCGTLLERIITVMPMTDDLKGREYNGGAEMIDVICANPKCAKPFRKKTTTASDLCIHCRNIESARAWREGHPEESRAIQRKHQDKKTNSRRQSGAVA